MNSPQGALRGLVKSQGELWAGVEESILNTGICMTLQSDLEQHITNTVNQVSFYRMTYLPCFYWQDLLVIMEERIKPWYIWSVLLNHFLLESKQWTKCAPMLMLTKVQVVFSSFFNSFSESLNPLVLDMHCCLELFPVSKCPIWGRHATVGQRRVNLAVPKHTQSCCQELDYLKEFSAQKHCRMLSWSLQPFPANLLGYDRWQETGAAN